MGSDFPEVTSDRRIPNGNIIYTVLYCIFETRQTLSYEHYSGELIYFRPEKDVFTSLFHWNFPAKLSQFCVDLTPTTENTAALEKIDLR